jgi:hypothetical protein
MPDRDLQEKILSFPRLPESCLATGWFSHESMRQLREAIAAKVEALFGVVGGAAAAGYAGGWKRC